MEILRHVALAKATPTFMEARNVRFICLSTLVCIFTMLLCILTPVTTKQNIFRMFVLPGSQGERSKKIRKKKVKGQN
jgi:hypothetical protein